jgi:hypothetical protein
MRKRLFLNISVILLVSLLWGQYYYFEVQNSNINMFDMDATVQVIYRKIFKILVLLRNQLINALI